MYCKIDGDLLRQMVIDVPNDVRGIEELEKRGSYVIKQYLYGTLDRDPLAVPVAVTCRGVFNVGQCKLNSGSQLPTRIL